MTKKAKPGTAGAPSGLSVIVRRALINTAASRVEIDSIAAGFDASEARRRRDAHRSSALARLSAAGSRRS